MSMIGFSRFLSVPTPVCGPQDLRPEIVAPSWMRNWWALGADYLSCWTPPSDLPSRIRSAVRAVLFAREPDIHPQLRDRVLKEVLWFATEVPRKYATRYRSVAAWELQRKGTRVGEWVGLVAHEHVWTRATCRIRLLSAPDATAIEAIVSALQGCVVTKAEHQRLKPFDATHEGWARYIAAGVPVIDTSTGNHADLSALEAARRRVEGAGYRSDASPGRPGECADYGPYGPRPPNSAHPYAQL